MMMRQILLDPVPILRAGIAGIEEVPETVFGWRVVGLDIHLKRWRR